MNNKAALEFLFSALVLILFPTAAFGQRITSLVTTAKGHGEVIIPGGDRLKISAVNIVLKKTGEAQITILSDLQLSAQGRWTESENSDKEIELQITGSIVDGNAKGSGKLFLRDDRKSIARLTIDAQDKSGRNVKVEFVADEKPDEPVKDAIVSMISEM